MMLYRYSGPGLIELWAQTEAPKAGPIEPYEPLSCFENIFLLRICQDSSNKGILGGSSGREVTEDPSDQGSNPIGSIHHSQQQQ